jgi:hypothetical protein
MKQSRTPVESLENRVARTRFIPLEIEERRQRIQHQLLTHSESLRDPDFCSVSRSDVLELVVATDLEFLDGAIVHALDAEGSRFSTRISRRMTNAGGTTTLRKAVRNGVARREYEIAVSASLLFNTRFDESSATVAGLPVASRLDALQRIVEHELVHLIEMVVWEKSSCARERFREIARCLFGHRESSHCLMTPSQSARRHHGIGCGDEVSFQFRGKSLSGRVNRIGRRATVLVPDAQGERFTDGRYYRRYYVPVSELRKTGSAGRGHPSAVPRGNQNL